MKKQNLEELDKDFTYALNYLKQPLPKTDDAADELQRSLMQKAQEGKSLEACLKERAESQAKGRDLERRRKFRR